ncbi:MAG: HNH endonuclease [Chloroflexota bacterium]
MAISDENRRAVRQEYNFACGYCGVSETDVGSELEIDHFQPISQGGSDELENLIYACPACNRNKATYWPSPDTPTHLNLLHPLTEHLHTHIRLLLDGHLAGLTPRGWFHIEWLHLNRPQLVALRQKQALYQRTQALIEETQQINRQLQNLIAAQEQELDILRDQVRRLTGIDS